MVSKHLFGFLFLIIVEISLCVDNYITTDTNTPEVGKKCTKKLNLCEINSINMGIPGDRGDPGEHGQKGDRGFTGLNGLPGRKRSCDEYCPEYFNAYSLVADIIMGPENDITSGTETAPTNRTCSERIDKTKDNIWVYPADKFQVHCPKTGRNTCLLNATHKDAKFIQENAFRSPPTQSTPFWLSHYNSNENNTNLFSLEQFYTITLNQIAWLQRRTDIVTQKIRVHFKNFCIMDTEMIGLQLLSWNDVAIGPLPTSFNPMSYNVLGNYTHTCKGEESKNKWQHIDITVKGDTKRLPIIDFYIQDTRNEDQSFFFEVLDLCFGKL